MRAHCKIASEYFKKKIALRVLERSLLFVARIDVEKWYVSMLLRTRAGELTLCLGIGIIKICYLHIVFAARFTLTHTYSNGVAKLNCEAFVLF